MADEKTIASSSGGGGAAGPVRPPALRADGADPAVAAWERAMSDWRGRDAAAAGAAG